MNPLGLSRESTERLRQQDAQNCAKVRGGGSLRYRGAFSAGAIDRRPVAVAADQASAARVLSDIPSWKYRRIRCNRLTGVHGANGQWVATHGA